MPAMPPDFGLKMERLPASCKAPATAGKDSQTIDNSASNADFILNPTRKRKYRATI
jgi:hypothetical protein